MTLPLFVVCSNSRSYTFLVIGDPCAHPAKLEEAYEANLNYIAEKEGADSPAFLLVKKTSQQ